MSWNPFSRHTGSKKSLGVSRHAERELERDVKKLEELEEASKKLYKDGRRFTEANTALGKAEQKIVQGLMGSGLCQCDESFQADMVTWESQLEELQRHRQDMNSNIQKTFVDPMKKFSSVFPAVQSAVKKRDQSLQEYNKIKSKFSKYQEKERTGQNIVKLDSNRKALDIAQKEFDTQDNAVRQDVAKLYEGRTEYFRPSFGALVRSQLTYNTEAFKMYSAVASELFRNSKCSENERKDRMKQTLADMKALSITKDD
ncbi:bridging integrator 3-like [Dreissena polymorpha]|uniref:BAR domain-containing protein n=1 Tax=Dreissena polymorpha TaxID=45954 RepID=A0A9D4BL60_DREPO|nr:bridging integrator 3-like [Dreissena polymorpha]KAH3707791.1 hypothetical protein DPMN_067207 [Dreissena polymorpha]